MKIAELTEKCELLKRYQRHIENPERYPIVTTIADCGEPLPLPQSELEKALKKNADALRAEIIAALRQPEDDDCCPYCGNYATELCSYCIFHGGNKLRFSTTLNS